MEYTVKLSRAQEKELKKEAVLYGMDDAGEYLLEKMKTIIRWEETESIRNLMQKNVLSTKQKNILKEFAEKYYENVSKAKVFFENEEHFMIRLKVKLNEINR